MLLEMTPQHFCLRSSKQCFGGDVRQGEAPGPIPDGDEDPRHPDIHVLALQGGVLHILRLLANIDGPKGRPAWHVIAGQLQPSQHLANKTDHSLFQNLLFTVIFT